MSFLSDLWSTFASSSDAAIDRIYHTPAKQWVAQFAPPTSAPGLAAAQQTPILASKHYVTVTAQKIAVPNARVLFTTFYPAVHSTVLVRNAAGQVNSISTFSVLDPDLIAIDAHAPEKVVQGPRTLLDSAPFLGAQFVSTFALLSVKAVDYARPFLSTLEKLSSLAGVSFFAAAAPFAEPLLTGIQALTQLSGGAGTQIVYAGNLPLNTGIFLIAATETAGFTWSSYTFAQDYTLLRQGAPVADFPYMVLTVESSDERLNWKEIPALRSAEDALDQAVKAAGRKISVEGSDERNQVDQALYAFRWACLHCDDLCRADALRVADLAQDDVTALLSGGGIKAPATRSLDDFDVAHARPSAPGFSLDKIALFPRPR
jgi:hypothetical protein